MIINTYTSLIDAHHKLVKDGFTSSFVFEDGKMKCTENKMKYTPKDMSIVCYQRFEGMTNPSDMSIIFAVTCTDGTKGTIISSYGTYADIKLIEFVDKVKIEEKRAVYNGD